MGLPMPESNFTENDYHNIVHLTYWYNYFRICNDFSKAYNTKKFKKII